MSSPPPPLKQWSKNNLVREVERLRSLLHAQAEYPADAPTSGGDFADVAGDPHARGGVVLDTRSAVLMDQLDVILVDRDPGSEDPPSMALVLGGRVNLRRDRIKQMYLFGTDGAAALVTQIVGLSERAGGEFLAAFRVAFEDRTKDMP